MSAQVIARDTLNNRTMLTIHREDAERYLWGDDEFQAWCDEFIAEKFEETLDLDFPIKTENLIKLMKDQGVWIEYMNEWFYEFLHSYEKENSHKCFDDLSDYSQQYRRDNFVGYYND